MKKILGIMAVTLGVFVFAALASASTTDVLQPASATTNLESLRVGVAGQGGVTFFNGTVLNEGDDPFTVGDDMRVDGEIYRLQKGEDPIKISDNVIPTLTNTNNFGTSANRWKNIYAKNGNFSGKLVVNGNQIGVTLAQAVSSTAPGSASEPGQLDASTWSGHAWRVNNQSGGPGGDASFQQTTGISVTFTPTSSTTGTFNSTESFLYDPANQVCSPPVDACNWGEPPFGSGAVNHSTRTGTYKIVGDAMLIKDIYPSMDFQIGGSVNQDKFGKTLTDFVADADTMTFKGDLGRYYLSRQ